VKDKLRMARTFLENFIIGGALVTVALWIAYVSDPAIGGFIAGLPLRFGVTWIITAKRHGEEFAKKMAKGSLKGMIGSVISTLFIFFTIGMLGLTLAFTMAVLICVGIIAALKLTFPE
jgi:uncharacterized membrane protein (GlpM family)